MSQCELGTVSIGTREEAPDGVQSVGPDPEWQWNSTLNARLADTGAQECRVLLGLSGPPGAPRRAKMVAWKRQ